MSKASIVFGDILEEECDYPWGNYPWENSSESSREAADQFMGEFNQWAEENGLSGRLIMDFYHVNGDSIEGFVVYTREVIADDSKSDSHHPTRLSLSSLNIGDNQDSQEIFEKVNSDFDLFLEPSWLLLVINNT